ncbi:uncharacterized protein LOC121868984 [Homarus americanus]|uniref:uncharacterized protein LOC121868983 n=1 Tax=Homarus americanus TaxID=6706 RepID=UPI001C437060|nr:uncharacterized protein LOC121868983 [Homarus americanus]XP_042225967.1 uncharacterized protein LOC121868984 [Homarus americanus]
MKDEGTYDCQVNIHPKISTKFHLKVLPDTGQASILDIPVSDTGVVSQPEAVRDEEPETGIRVKVLGDRWVRLNTGATLRLVCEATGKALTELREHSFLHNDPLISWTLDGIPVTTLWPHTKVVVRESWGRTVVESELEVRTLHPSDGGTYACAVPRAQPDRVTLTVSNTRSYDGASKLASSGNGDPPPLAAGDDPSAVSSGGSDSAASAGKAAVISGAIILLLLLIQAALCVFYIKKV